MQEQLLLLPVLFPIAFGAVLYFLRFKKERTVRCVVFAAVALNALLIWALILTCGTDSYHLLDFDEGITIQFRFDALGRLFAGLIAVLWPLTTLYAFSYMAEDKRKKSFFCFFVISFGVTMGICTAGNLLTMYCFYEFLTLATLPLVIHTMSRPAIRAGRAYLCFSIGGAAFAFIAVVYLISVGSADGFVFGGVINTGAGALNRMQIIYVLGFLGFGVKAALFPVHAWLPQASVAPTPVTALLHAVAVVKAGAFAIIRLTYYVFDTELLTGTWAQTVVMAVAAFTILYGSSMALKQSHFKRRLAYSTVANMSYIVYGAALMTPEGLAAGLLHLLFHAVIKIMAFFCAGAVMHNTKREYVEELDGLGRKMPLTFGCFTIAALALSGIPPLNGFFSKWGLLTASVSAFSSQPMALIGAAALLISALLTAMYMLTPAVRAFFPKAETDLTALSGIREAEPLMWIPIVLLAAAVVVTGLCAGTFSSLCAMIAGGL